jgi:hypothetical protein
MLKFLIPSLCSPCILVDDTRRVVIRRENSTTTAFVAPIVVIGDMKMMPTGHDTYLGVIPQTFTPNDTSFSSELSMSKNCGFCDGVVAVERFGGDTSLRGVGRLRN